MKKIKDKLTKKCAGSGILDPEKIIIPDPDPGGKKPPDPQHWLYLNRFPCLIFLVDCRVNFAVTKEN
jgi:hypothetical protein